MAELRAVVGHSEDVDSERAVAAVIDQVERELGGGTPQAGVLYAGIDHDHPTAVATVRSHWPGIELIGCTTDGESSSNGEFCEDSLALIVFDSDEVVFGAGVGRNVSDDPAAAARQAVESARAGLGSDPKLLLVTPESMTVSGVALVDALREVVGPEIPVVGGFAGDQYRLKQTEQFFGDEVLSDACPVLAIGGPLVFSVGVESGWRPLGRRGTVTRVEGNVVFEIDNQPAIDFYGHYLGKAVIDSELFLGDIPLAVFEDGDRFYLRAPLSLDRNAGTITFFADVTPGATVQLSGAQREEILEGSRASVDNALRDYPGSQPDAALFFSCAARKQLLGTRTAEETRILRGALSPDVPLCGFYAYGEIGPLAEGSASRFHNETFVTLLMGTQ